MSNLTVQFSETLLELVNAAKAKGFDYRIEEYQRKTFFSFRIDKRKNSMIWYSFSGYGTTATVGRMSFEKRYNGANGSTIKSINQWLKAESYLDI